MPAILGSESLHNKLGIPDVSKKFNLCSDDAGLAI